MRSPRDSPGVPSPLARYTPDSRPWRRRIAAAAAVGAPLSLSAAFAVASGVKSGMVYDLLVLAFGLLSLSLPAVAATTLLAPDSGLSRTEPSRGDSPVETLKRRYAAGELSRKEFDRRLDDILAAGNASDDAADDPAGKRAAREAGSDAIR